MTEARAWRLAALGLALMAMGMSSLTGCQDPVEGAETRGTGAPGNDAVIGEAAGDPEIEQEGAGSAVGQAAAGAHERSAHGGDEAPGGSVGTDNPLRTVPAELATARGGGEAADAIDSPDAINSPDAAADHAENPSSTPAGEGPTIHNDVINRFEITRFALARDIVDREPVGITNSFQRGSGPLHVFIEARNRTGENVELRVGFSPAESERRGAGVRLNVPSTFRYRTRARANTRRSAGEWLCLVTDDRGRTLVEQRFRITESE